MGKSFDTILDGYHRFREKYAEGDNSVMRSLSYHGQKPQTMVIACCDSRVDPAVILQCDPGDLFVVRNVANIVPPYEIDDAHHGTSAALEFGVCFLNVSDLILLGHSQCGGIQALFENESLVGHQNDFISNWVSLIRRPEIHDCSVDQYAKLALNASYNNCMSFPWIQERIQSGELRIHLWFFDVSQGKIFRYMETTQVYEAL